MKRLDDEETVIQLGDVGLYAVIEESSGTYSLRYPNSNYNFYVDVDETIDLSPVFSGYMNFSVSPTFPEGLSLSPNSGRIYGRVTEALVSNQGYQITATHAASSDSSSTSLSLNIARRRSVDE